MEYIIVKGHNEKDLEKRVNEKLAEGFELKGGLVVADEGHLLQVMTKTGVPS